MLNGSVSCVELCIAAIFLQPGRYIFSIFCCEVKRDAGKKSLRFIVLVNQVFLVLISRYPLLPSTTKIWHGLRLGLYRGHCVSPWHPVHWQGKWLSSSAHTGSSECGSAQTCLKCSLCCSTEKQWATQNCWALCLGNTDSHLTLCVSYTVTL